MLRVGVDVGGTFTDLFAYDDETGEVVSAKVLTTVENQAVGVMQSIEAAGVSLAEVEYLAHGTTTGTNALLERRGARTGLLTTEGFRDVLEIMRTDRQSGYDLQWVKPVPFVPRRYRLEVVERVDKDGNVEVALDEDAARAAIAKLRDAGVESIAVSLLFSYANPAHEKRLAELVEEVAPGVSVSLSSEINAEYREYERTNTVVIDAYIKPTMVRYIRRLVEEAAGAGLSAKGSGGLSGRVFLMQGSGGLVTAERATEKPISTLSSGPAAGAIAAAAIAARLGIGDIVTFDVGGTSTDVALIHDGKPYLNTQKQVEWGLPSRVPMLDVESVGAGGGSIGWIDQGGALKMGPQSGGSTPGPVCYGRGGTEPTLSDALLLKGILADTLADGRVRLDAEAARRAVNEKLAQPLGLSVDRVVLGMIEIAQNNMANAARSVSIWKGLDPRDLTLVAFGGGGGMVAGAVARSLSIPRVLVPPVPGNACAMGLLMTNFQEDTAVAYLSRADETDVDEVNARLDALREETLERLRAQGVEESEAQLTYGADVRYRGQVYELRIPFPEFPITQASLNDLVREFEDVYESVYTIRLEQGVPEMVSLRVTASAALPRYELVPKVRRPDAVAEPKGSRDVLEEDGTVSVDVYDRYTLAPGTRLEGPVILEEPGSTIWIAAGMACDVDEFENLIIHTDASGATEPQTAAAVAAGASEGS
ncbi:hydantoinase/oxoprolinase family protein [Capillimicrobium parvum]|uniref:Acetophenone carboxylase gamma subunit n=1 Tax=Capillimicrobium parvum TaxID=2884022 RepID=A0A9E6Y1F6_9ACTN|nr:hydantoinase/oxoprolinase family protein [Capillimicrobium parvum]UGS38314.1 Acetophenone carboxylase gamma subunit [Capillimicrobium parvum]